MTVSSNASVLRVDQGVLRWWQAGDSVSRDVPDVSGLPENTVFAVPSDALRLGALQVSPAETKHLHKSLPFLLEEDVIDEVEALHCAYSLESEGAVAYGVTTRACMEAWSALLPDGWEGPWLPEALLLHVRDDEACLIMETDSVLVRVGHGVGTRIPNTLLIAFLTSLTAPPLTVSVYGADQHEDLARLPEAWLANAQWRHGGFGQALLLSTGAEKLMDMRQGDYAPRLPFARWWGYWRQVAIVAGVALLIHVGADVLAVQRLESDNLALRAAIAASYRQANPQGAVVDPEKQLDRQLAEYRPSSSGIAFTPMLAAITQSVASAKGLGITALNFNASSGEVRLDLTADNYNLVEELRQRLERQGMNATLETSSSRDDQVRARLRVEDRSS